MPGPLPLLTETNANRYAALLRARRIFELAAALEQRRGRPLALGQAAVAVLVEARQLGAGRADTVADGAGALFDPLEPRAARFPAEGFATGRRERFGDAARLRVQAGGAFCVGRYAVALLVELTESGAALQPVGPASALALLGASVDLCLAEAQLSGAAARLLKAKPTDETEGGCSNGSSVGPP